MSEFNVHKNRTADGVVITEGMTVVTNEWRKGTVLADTSTYCCGNPDHNGQFVSGSYYFTDHNKRDCDGSPVGCHHDHWFEVQYDTGGLVQMNGERLGAKIPAGVE